MKSDQKDEELKREVAKVNDNNAIINNSDTSLTSSTDFSYIEALANHLDSLQKVAGVFIKGGLCPIKNESDFIVATVSGQQLGLPMITAINNIIVISNKPSITTHLMRALLLKAGVVFRKVYDFAAQYQLYEAETVEGNKVAKKIGNPPTPIPRGILTLGDKEPDDLVAGRKEIDRITQYEFTRQLKQPDGTYREVTVISSFKMSDANKAELLDKDNYSKYPARMLDARAFAIGAREIASDILFGMYTVSELADSNNINYTMDANYQETIDSEIEIVD